MFLSLFRGEARAVDDFTEQFYKSKKWKKKREAILKRDKYMCRECAKYGRRKDAVCVHHIKHLEEFPELGLDSDNLISLCAACHNKAHPEKSPLFHFQKPPRPDLFF